MNVKEKILEIIESYGAIDAPSIQHALYRETGNFFYKNEIRAVLYYLIRNNLIKIEGNFYLKND